MRIEYDLREGDSLALRDRENGIVVKTRRGTFEFHGEGDGVALWLDGAIVFSSECESDPPEFGGWLAAYEATMNLIGRYIQQLETKPRKEWTRLDVENVKALSALISTDYFKSLPCEACGGSGLRDLGPDSAGDHCNHCGGAGTYDASDPDRVDCPECQGAGWTLEPGPSCEKLRERCKRCHGSGTVLPPEPRHGIGGKLNAPYHDEPDDEPEAEPERVRCPVCRGQAHFPGHGGVAKACSHCGGLGTVVPRQCELFDGEHEIPPRCPDCQGAGYAGFNTDAICVSCNGTGIEGGKL